MIVLFAAIVVCIATLVLARQHRTTGAADGAVPRVVDIGSVTKQHPAHSSPIEAGIRLPAPPRGSPVAQVQDALRARAEQGDAAAASLLARDLSLCWWMLEQANVQKPDYRDPGEPRDLSAEEQHWIDGWEEAQDFIRRNGGYCQGIEVNEIDRLKASALLAAAKLGDEEAAACFIEDSMLYARPIADDGRYPAERDDPELAAMYDAEGLRLAEAGVRRGDWRMVGMLSAVYEVASSANPFGNKLSQPNGEKHFLYLTLERLGFVDPDQLQRIKDMPLQPEEFGISDSKARELRDEAQHLFDAYFRDSGPMPADGLALCDM